MRHIYVLTLETSQWRDLSDLTQQVAQVLYDNELLDIGDVVTHPAFQTERGTYAVTISDTGEALPQVAERAR